MNLLILGGTSFVGRCITHAALTQSHQVSLFHRGLTQPASFPKPNTSTATATANWTPCARAVGTLLLT